MGSYGNNIRKHRIKAGLTQEALAGKAGITRPALSTYECGSRTPPLEVFQRIADALNVSMDQLAGRNTPGGKRTPLGTAISALTEAGITATPLFGDSYAVSYKVDNDYGYFEHAAEVAEDDLIAAYRLLNSSRVLTHVRQLKNRLCGQFFDELIYRRKSSL